MTDEDPAHRLTHAPRDAVTIALTQHDVVSKEHLQPLLADLPVGSTVIVLTVRQHAELVARAAGDRLADPFRPLHGPHTKDMDDRILSALLSATDMKVSLIDNGFCGLLVVPESTIIRTGPLSDDDPLVTVVRDATARDEQD